MRRRLSTRAARAVYRRRPNWMQSRYRTHFLYNERAAHGGYPQSKRFDRPNRLLRGYPPCAALSDKGARFQTKVVAATSGTPKGDATGPADDRRARGVLVPAGRGGGGPSLPSWGGHGPVLSEPVLPGFWADEPPATGGFLPCLGGGGGPWPPSGGGGGGPLPSSGGGGGGPPSGGGGGPFWGPALAALSTLGRLTAVRPGTGGQHRSRQVKPPSSATPAKSRPLDTLIFSLHFPSK